MTDTSTVVLGVIGLLLTGTIGAATVWIMWYGPIYVLNIQRQLEEDREQRKGDSIKIGRLVFYRIDSVRARLTQPEKKPATNVRSSGRHLKRA